MKKIVICLMATVLSLTLIPLQLNAATKTVSSSLVDPKPVESKESAEAKVLLLRLDEIKTLDKSTLASKDKKALRKEVKSIKHRLSDIGGGVYLSGAALVIIIILLIVLL